MKLTLSKQDINLYVKLTTMEKLVSLDIRNYEE